ncbi:Basic blue protein [Morella rubra]|uniref:Basic blue protein n=1 Tax=Morella rubra TaxID=262757 RepID=A0A6A1VBC0_9ROSI|nr:Basic blue protein [Morella rubra]
MKRKFPGQALTQILHPQLSSLVSLLVYVLFVEDFISQMAQRRASATVAAVLLFCLLLHRENVWAATFTVGDGRGWTFNVEGWPRGKTFKSGDVLVFNYNRALHNVVVVDRRGYDDCKAPAGAKTFQSGSDKIKLVKGPNYFICTFPGHCQSKMKIAVYAL